MCCIEFGEKNSAEILTDVVCVYTMGFEKKVTELQEIIDNQK